MSRFVSRCCITALLSVCLTHLVGADEPERLYSTIDACEEFEDSTAKYVIQNTSIRDRAAREAAMKKLDAAVDKWSGRKFKIESDVVEVTWNEHRTTQLADGLKFSSTKQLMWIRFKPLNMSGVRSPGAFPHAHSIPVVATKEDALKISPKDNVRIVARAQWSREKNPPGFSLFSIRSTQGDYENKPMGSFTSIDYVVTVNGKTFADPWDDPDPQEAEKPMVNADD